MSASDADYIYGSYTGSNSYLSGLSALTDPASSSSHTVYFRAWYTPTPSVPTINDQTLLVSLYEGASLVAFSSEILSDAATTYSFTLSSGEADAITDYTALRLRFDATDGDTSCTFHVSWAEFECPDEPPVSDPVSVTSFGIGDIGARIFNRPLQAPSTNGASNEVGINIESKVDTTSHRNKYADPINREDALSGGVCSRTGLWFPGRMLVTVGGKRYGAPFAPRER